MPGTESDEERSLRAELAAAVRAEDRGRLHAALAICAGRALQYRKMNLHEDASARAYAETSQALQRAYEDYRAAIKAFGDARADDGRALLRKARPVIVAELGALHPYAQQVTNTLAGRLRGVDALTEKLELRTWLVESKRAVFGRDHTTSLQHLSDLAYVLAALGRTDEAIAAFEEAIAGLARGPWPGEAVRHLRRLFDLCEAAGTPERTRPLEHLALAHAPHAVAEVRSVFFRRCPAAALSFNAEALRQCAPHVPALRTAALIVCARVSDGEAEPSAVNDPETYEDAATRAFARAIRAFERLAVVPRAGAELGDGQDPAREVLTSLARIDRANRALHKEGAPGASLGEDDDDEDDEGDEDGPLASAERARQLAHFEALFRADE
ncbi:MAG: hypothetical protein R3B48_29975 [Kofleriaceae bacterium]